MVRRGATAPRHSGCPGSRCHGDRSRPSRRGDWPGLTHAWASRRALIGQRRTPRPDCGRGRAASAVVCAEKVRGGRRGGGTGPRASGVTGEAGAYLGRARGWGRRWRLWRGRRGPGSPERPVSPAGGGGPGELQPRARCLVSPSPAQPCAAAASPGPRYNGRLGQRRVVLRGAPGCGLCGERWRARAGGTVKTYSLTRNGILCKNFS